MSGIITVTFLCNPNGSGYVASKIYHGDFGYESALRATNQSYKQFGLGEFNSELGLTDRISR